MYELRSFSSIPKYIKDQLFSSTVIINRRTLLHLSILAGAGLALPSFANPAVPQRQRILIRNATLVTMDPQPGDL